MIDGEFEIFLMAIKRHGAVINFPRLTSWLQNVKRKMAGLSLRSSRHELREVFEELSACRQVSHPTWQGGRDFQTV